MRVIFSQESFEYIKVIFFSPKNAKILPQKKSGWKVWIFFPLFAGGELRAKP
jgi:hypothetical protein